MTWFSWCAPDHQNAMYLPSYSVGNQTCSCTTTSYLTSETCPKGDVLDITWYWCLDRILRSNLTLVLRPWSEMTSTWTVCNSTTRENNVFLGVSLVYQYSQVLDTRRCSRPEITCRNHDIWSIYHDLEDLSNALLSNITHKIHTNTRRILGVFRVHLQG